MPCRPACWTPAGATSGGTRPACYLSSTGQPSRDTTVRFEIDAYPDDEPEDTFTNTRLLIDYALACKAEELVVRAADVQYDQPVFDVPLSLISQHLRTIHLERVNLDCSDLKFSGCPVLEDLRACTMVAYGYICTPAPSPSRPRSACLVRDHDTLQHALLTAGLQQNAHEHPALLANGLALVLRTGITHTHAPPCFSDAHTRDPATGPTRPYTCSTCPPRWRRGLFAQQ
uniref:Uncharacterized protein n=1 Tax=Triticum urartu TaxID=4572 RepID=A0A8R7QVF1_TRIUA